LRAAETIAEAMLEIEPQKRQLDGKRSNLPKPHRKEIQEKKRGYVYLRSREDKNSL
jgi:hypothetical protein